VQIEPGLKSYRLSMQVGSESRELRDADCRELFRAAVVVAVAIVSSDARTRPRGAEAAPKESAIDRATSDSDDVEGRVSASPRTEFGMSLGSGLKLGLLPAPALALELEAKTGWGAVGIAAGARYLTPSSAEDGPRRVTVSALGAHVVGLLRPSRSWEARAGVAAYRLSGSGTGTLESGSDSAWTLAPVAGILLIPFQSSGAWAGVAGEGQLNLLRSRFEILNHGEIFSVPLVSGAAFLRFGWQFL
jgi:hypothetical protein